MNTALAVVSFGTAVAEAREDIRQVEQALAAQRAGDDFFRAFTSPTIRRRWAERGEQIDGLPEMLERLAGLGYTRVLVQPTHLLYGEEYDRIREDTAAWTGRFELLALGKPLIAGQADLSALSECTARLAGAGETLILLGHGTAHFANMAYPALQTTLRLAGSDALVGTVEGWPGFPEVLAQLKACGHNRVLLAPLMLTAGDHALRDMAGGGADSWKSRLEAEGYSVRCRMEGLGRLPEIQSLYRRHLKELGDAYGV